jgi:hypothetical protein
MTLLKMKSHPMNRTPLEEIASGNPIASRANKISNNGHTTDHAGIRFAMAANVWVMLALSAPVSIR